MKRILFISLAILLTLISCNGQTKKTEKQPKNDLPQTNIKVKKDYDKNGNIVRYDSSYSSFYSNIKGDSVLRDSIFNNFRQKFNQNYFFSDQPYFKNFFFVDSLLKYDFYKKNFFYDRFKNDMARMDSLFRGMDRMKNDFFDKQFKPENKIKK
jgi:hypothetical protein